MSQELVDTQEKALRINLDSAVYGSFAEIGAGQEVARWFFRVGAAAKTVAKTMSAYDMIVSDAIYGVEKDHRYVVESRLDKMIQHEFDLVVERLSEKRGSNTNFFAFADTVAAKSFKGNNECHGWMGIRFQARPGGAPNDVVIHVRMLDEENLEQQEALGIVGVNLCYAAFYLRDNLQEFVKSLTDGIKGHRVEIDVIRFRGPDVKHIDPRLASLFLVQQHHTSAVIFSPNGEVLPPREALYKKDVLVLRGSFRPVTQLNMDMFRSGREMFRKQIKDDSNNTMPLMEITLNSLGTEVGLDAQDFLDRIDTLGALGYSVLLSNFPEYYSLSLFFRRYTQGRIGIILGVAHLKEIFKEEYYKGLDGGLLEAFGKLFRGDVKLYVYPAKSLSTAPTSKDAAKEMITARNFPRPIGLEHFYEHLLSCNYIVDLDNFDPKNLDIFSREIMQQIQTGQIAWEQKVPAEVVNLIKSKKLFGYKMKKNAA
jgi:hypothetical protein